MIEMWWISLLYGGVLGARLMLPEEAQPRLLLWLAPIGHVLGWAFYLLTQKASFGTLLALTPTMSWGALALVVSLLPLWFDQEQARPEFQDAGLLLAAIFSLLWGMTLDVQLAVPRSFFALCASWLLDIGGGFLLLLAILGWRIYLDESDEQQDLLRWLQTLQSAALLSFTAALLCTFMASPHLSLSTQGAIIFLLIAAGGALSPTLQADGESTRPLTLSFPYRTWLAVGAFFTVGWSVTRLFALV